MAELKKVGEFSESLPKIIHREQDHEFSNLVKNIVSDIGAEKVIDFGCGDGRLCKIFDKSAYLGLDIDEEALEKARRSFSDYAFNKSQDTVYSTHMCIASRVFNEMSDKKINEMLKNMRCKWLLVAEPLNGKADTSMINFSHRTREDYISMMRDHDLLLFKHMIKTVKKDAEEDVSFLLFRKCERNPIA